MEPVGMGLIGCGFMGTTYARILAESRETKLVGVADVDEERAQSLAVCYRVPAYQDFRDLLWDEGVQAVVVATSDQAHLDPCVAAAQAGKHIFVEKPLATTAGDGAQIIDAAHKAGVVLLVGHTLRFSPPYFMAREAIVGGRLGEIIHMYARRNGPLIRSGLRLAGRTSVAFYLAIHDIDFMNWCIPNMVRSVCAHARQELLSHLNVDDTIFSILEYENGVLACVESSWIMPSCYGPQGSSNFEAVGTEGVVHIHPHEQGLTIQDANDAQRLRPYEEPIMHDRKWGEYNYEVTHFLDCIVEGKQPVCTGEEALQAVVVVEAIHRSLAAGTKVTLH